MKCTGCVKLAEVAHDHVRVCILFSSAKNKRVLSMLFVDPDAAARPIKTNPIHWLTGLTVWLMAGVKEVWLVDLRIKPLRNRTLLIFIEWMKTSK